VHSGAAATSDSFTFMVSDGAGGTVGATILTFTVSPFIPPPGEGRDSGSTGGQEGQVLDLVRSLGPAVVTPCPKYHRLLCR
ncbi:MAG: hypothetical protein ACXW4A_02310, partial [Nitrospira sp.]